MSLKTAVQGMQDKKRELLDGIKESKIEVRKIDQAVKAVEKIDGTKRKRRRRTTKSKAKTTQTRTRKEVRKPRPDTNKRLVFDVVKEQKKATANEVHALVNGLSKQNVFNIMSDLAKQGYLKTALTNGKRPYTYRVA